MKIVGLRVEKYIQKDLSPEDNEKRIEDRYILYALDEFEQKIEITLYKEIGMCPSGYCAASWGQINARLVNEFGPMEYVAVKDLYIRTIKGEKVVNKVFQVDYDGDDPFYPCGYVKVNMNLFRKTKRTLKNRPVWIFKGDSNLGKSYLANNFNKNNIKVYETDSSSKLPSNIYADVIIKGNKYNFSINDIDQRIFGKHKLIFVDFSEEKINIEN